MNLTMKKISTPVLMSLFILFSINLSAQIIDGWEMVNPKPTTADLRVVEFIDLNSGFVSDGQHTYYTPDFGETWENRGDLPGASDIEFLGNKGILTSVYTDGIYMTEDGGETWTISNIPGMLYIQNCQFISEEFIVVTSYSSLAYSLNGGSSWTIEQFYDNDIKDSFFRADSSGVAVSYSGSIYYTETMGQIWQLAYSGWSETFSLVKFVNDSVGFAIQDIYDSPSLKTTDGGITWAQAPDGFCCNITDMMFTDANTCYFIGTGGYVGRLVSDDFLWETMELTNLSTNWNVDFLGIESIENRLFVVGDDGWILKSWDEGENFSINQNIRFGVENVFFFDSNVGLAVAGYNNKIYKTYNGGGSWEMIFEVPMPGSKIADISFMNENVGFLSTKDSWAPDDYYMTVNGGYSWSVIDQLGYYVEHVSLLEWIDNDTWITSTESALSNNNSLKGTYLITEMGAVWTQVHENSIMDVSIVTADIIYGYTYDSNKIIVVKSEDGGNTWADLYEFEEEGLRVSDMEFTIAGIGHCLIDGNQYYRSLDGGMSWDLVHVFSNSWVNNEKLRFADDQYGFMLRGYNILSTIDGGDSWEPMISDNDVRNIKIYGDHLYRYGQKGTIYRYLLSALHSSITKYPDVVNWNIFPNPSQGSFTIDIGELVISRIQVLDIQGKIVKDITAFNGNQINMDLSSAQNGIYIVKIFSEDQVSAKKVVIM